MCVRVVRPLLALLLVFGVLAGSGAARAGGQPPPLVLARGADGALWFAETYGAAVGRLDPDGSLRRFPIAWGAMVTGIAADRAGNLWLAESLAGRIGRLSPDGLLREYPLPAARQMPREIVLGSDGNLWFTLTYDSAIGRITPAGEVTEYPLATHAFPTNLTAGPDGALWFVDNTNESVMRITTGGQIGSFSLRALRGAQGDSLFISALAVGPDRDLWFTDTDGGNVRIGRLTTSGAITEFPLTGSTQSYPRAIAAAGGAVWFTEPALSYPRSTDGPTIGRITTSGAVALYPLPSPLATPAQILAGPRGTLWFTDGEWPWLGRITTGGQVGYIPLWPLKGDPSGLTIRSLYSTSQQSYARWNGHTDTPPVRLDRFAAGTSQVAYYFTFSGAHPDLTRFNAVIYDFDGTPFVHGITHLLQHRAGGFMALFTYRPAFPPGVYRLDLQVAGRSIADTAFIVER